MPDRDSPLVAELRRRLGAERVLNSAEDLAVYAYDGTAVLRQNPACVVFPKTTDEVAACVRAARRARHADRHARLGHGPERRQRADRRAASCSA